MTFVSARLCGHANLSTECLNCAVSVHLLTTAAVSGAGGRETAGRLWLLLFAVMSGFHLF